MRLFMEQNFVYEHTELYEAYVRTRAVVVVLQIIRLVR